jgi:hypothetical protein
MILLTVNYPTNSSEKSTADPGKARHIRVT